jgi:hypothetical protein
LEIIDEPANGRPGKPVHCPDKLYSLLFEHCWDPNPKDRSKFSSIKDRLQEVRLPVHCNQQNCQATESFVKAWTIIGLINIHCIIDDHLFD